MELNIRNAAKLLFPNPSLEMIYMEAVSNSIDANASKIEIRINLNSFSDFNSLKIEVEDNGDGFSDKNFAKFKKLLEVEEAAEENHKGLGRLVYLRYFNSVSIVSDFEAGIKKLKRKFIFNDKFKDQFEIEENASKERKTILKFTDYKLQKIYSYDSVKALSIKEELLTHFYPLFYRLKVENKVLSIKIVVNVKIPNNEQAFYSDSQILNVSELPELKQEPLNENNIDLLSEFNLNYSIKKLPNTLQKSSTITAICVDERTVKVDILSKVGIPDGYEIIFILYSKFFTGKVNSSRQNLIIDDNTLRNVKKLFGNKLAEILNREIPEIHKRNIETTKILEETYPHLRGLFDENPVGLVDKHASLEVAQNKFFKEQKEILNAITLTEAQYEKSIEISSRLLTEYILYRNITINKLRQIDPNNLESHIHNIIVPAKKVFSKSTFIDDLYTNNAWILDDKYMTYSTILSERDIGELVSNITNLEIKDDTLRPDIAIVFSNDPTPLKTDEKIDVVIVELKRLGLNIGDKNNVYVQLIQRAMKLLEYYPNKIQRIWFYGIVDIDEEFKRILKSQGFTELYSKGTVMYRNSEVELPNGEKIPTGFFIQSFDAVIEDAASRNETFLKILKEGFKDKSEV